MYLEFRLNQNDGSIADETETTTLKKKTDMCALRAFFYILFVLQIK